MNSFENEIKTVFEKYGINLSDYQIKQFKDYYELLIDWNSKVNLTAITEQKDVIIKHFLDSVLCFNEFKKGASLIDVGTGAGFPAVPLKILRPDLKICLVDSLQKRINFLKELNLVLKLEDVNFVHGRSEQLAYMEEFREKFDYCVSRAVATLNVLCELCSPFVKVNGQMICYKSKNLNVEIEQSANAFNVLNLKTNKTLSYFIEQTDAQRNVLIINKIGKTPKHYPRIGNKPRLKPL